MSQFYNESGKSTTAGQCPFLADEIKIDRIEMSNEESVFISYDSHEIRFDVFIRGSDRIFDIEIQSTDTKDLPEGSRYYQEVMDVDTLKSRQKYMKMKTSHVIFICMKDIFKNVCPMK